VVTDTLRSFWPGNAVEMDLLNVAKKMMSGAILVKTTSCDNRSSFVRQDLGHRNHHLHLWHLADMMGASSNVLNVISPDCAANCENVATDAAAVQNPRKRRGLNVEEDKNVKTKEKKVEAFQMGVVASLSSISISQKEETFSKKKKPLCEDSSCR